MTNRLTAILLAALSAAPGCKPDKPHDRGPDQDQLIKERVAIVASVQEKLRRVDPGVVVRADGAFDDVLVFEISDCSVVNSALDLNGGALTTQLRGMGFESVQCLTSGKQTWKRSL